MKMHLSYRERIVGLFLLFTVLGVVAFIVGAAIKNKWFEPRVSYHTHVVRGEGLHTGSPVLLSGLEVGEVGTLSILEDNRIDVQILVLEHHAHRVRQGTIAEVRRLVGIGEKRIHLVSREESGEQLPPFAFLAANEPMDILDAVANVDLNKYFGALDRAVSAMEVVLNKLEEKERLERMLVAFEQMGPTLEQLKLLLTDINKPLVELISDPSLIKTFRGADKVFNDPNTRKTMRAMATTFNPKKMGSLIDRMEVASIRLDDALKEDSVFQGAMSGANKLLNDGRLDRMLTTMEKLSDPKKLEKLVNNMAVIASELAKIGPKIPTMTREMINTLQEAVVVLKALQKTWLLDDESEEVRKEIRKRK